MFKESDPIEVIDGRWKGHAGIVAQVVPIRVDGREIGERYRVALEATPESPNVPDLVILLGKQLKKRDAV